MTVFHYTALDAKGNEIHADIQALSSKEAVSKIRSQGLYPTKIRSPKSKKQAEKTVVSNKHVYRSRKIKAKRLAQFARQLATLQDAGLTIMRSLRLLEAQEESKSLKRVIRTVADDIEGGASLSEAMRRHPKVFNRLFVNMAAAGETGGVLDVILNRSAEFMEKTERLKSRIKGAMVYPAFVLTVAFFIVIGLMTFVIPVLADVLTDLSDKPAELPLITRALMRASDWLKGGYFLNAALITACPFIGFSVFKLLRRQGRIRYATDWLGLRLPVFGKLMYKTCVARWTRTLATLLDAGVPILDVLRITSETTENAVHASALSKVQRAVRQGDTFTNPLRQSGAVKMMVVNMVEVGEETGDLDKMLMKVADNYEEEADVMIGSLMSLLEPILIILLGIIVGIIVLAIFLPIFGNLPGML